MNTYTSLGYGDEATWGGRTPYPENHDEKIEALADETLDEEFNADAMAITLEHITDKDLAVKTVFEALAEGKRPSQAVIEQMLNELSETIEFAREWYKSNQRENKLKALKQKAIDDYIAGF